MNFPAAPLKSIVSLIIAANCAVFLAEFFGLAGAGGLFGGGGWLGGGFHGGAGNFGGGVPFSLKYGLNALFFGGAWWQPLTMMFIHGGVLHLAMNMLVLWQFGRAVEWRLGAARFALLYVIGGLLANAAALPFLWGDWGAGVLAGNFVGASGAVCALLGFVAFFDRFNRRALIVWVLVISFAPLLVGQNIAWQVHLCGFAVGFLAGKSRLLG